MIVIHDMSEARAALTGGLCDSVEPSVESSVEMVTAPGLVARAGIPWLQQVVKQLQQEFPDQPFTLAADCGDDAARVIEAIQAGLPLIFYNGPAARLNKLAAMGAVAGIDVIAGPGAS